jgi:hypothetical protein
MRKIILEDRDFLFLQGSPCVTGHTACSEAAFQVTAESDQVEVIRYRSMVNDNHDISVMDLMDLTGHL